MNITLNNDEEINSATMPNEVEEKVSLMHNLKKNPRTPWEPSALKDITLQSALSALRQKELIERLSRNQIS